MVSASQYLLLDRIAVGGMAEVYRAKSIGIEGFEKIVAIKRILPRLSADDDFIQMFVEEAKIAGRLRHANIARILELGKIEGTYFIAMEYVFGKDLVQIRTRMDELGQRVPAKMGAWIIANVLSGLDYAHRQRGADGAPLGLIHRDVSPHNVLVSHDGLVKLIDFGIAKAASRATQTAAGVVKGKLGYMSPEQTTGRPIDHRSDIFAATTCLYELLTGELLFARTGDLATIEAVRGEEAPPPSTLNPEISPELDAVILKGLAKKPELRWQSAAEMHEALMQYVMGSPPTCGAARVRDWMRDTFAEDVAAQSAHLEKLAKVEEPGVDVAPWSPAAEDEWGDEATVVTESPLGEQPDDAPKEVSNLVRLEDVVSDFGPDDRFSSVPGALPRASRPSIPEPSRAERISADWLNAEQANLQRTSDERISDAPIDAGEASDPRIGSSSIGDASINNVVSRDARIGGEVSSGEVSSGEVSGGEVGDARVSGSPQPVAEGEEEDEAFAWGALVLVALVAIVVGAGVVAAVLYFSGHSLPLISQ